MKQQKYIILFDGECNFCSFWVKFVIKRDKKDAFRFASLQSEIGRGLLKKNRIDEKLDAIVLIKESQFYIKSTAAFYILKMLGGRISVFYYFIYVPVFVRDFFYDIISKYRYHLFGCQSCEIPKDKNFTHKFLT